MESWQEVKDRLVKSSGKQEAYFEFLSYRDILLLFISGMPVVDIADGLEIENDAVESCLLQYFPKYVIMKVDSCNPAYEYRRNKDSTVFGYALKEDGISSKVIELYYEACELFYKLDKEF
jgi:hypothetical protein